MDIDHSISSAIVSKPDGNYDILFHSFSGSCQNCVYIRDHRRIEDTKIDPITGLDTTGLVHDAGIIVMASCFFGYIGVRLIDTISLYRERIFLCTSSEIFSFVIRGRGYFACIYTNISGVLQIETDLHDDPLFSYIWDGEVFSVVNSLTEMVVFERRISLSPQLPGEPTDEIIESYTLCIIEDPFSLESRGFLMACLEVLPIHHTSEGDLHFLIFGAVGQEELTRFIGFLGRYTCILTDQRLPIQGYLTRETASDSILTLPETVVASTEINSLDPRWGEFRMSLLELTYIEYLLHVHIESLQGGILSIQDTGISHAVLQFQERRLELTLHDAEILYPRYRSQKELLIELLRQKIS